MIACNSLLFSLNQKLLLTTFSLYAQFPKKENLILELSLDSHSITNPSNTSYYLLIIGLCVWTLENVSVLLFRCLGNKFYFPFERSPPSWTVWNVYLFVSLSISNFQFGRLLV